MEDDFASVPALGPQLKPMKYEGMTKTPEPEKVYLHQRTFLYRCEKGAVEARVFEEDEPLPKEGWYDTPQKALVATPRQPKGEPAVESMNEHSERSDRGRTPRHRRP